MKHLLWMSGMLLAACGDGDGGDPSDPVKGATWADVGPVVEQHCAECHQPGGVGPFEMDTYEDAKQWAAAAAASVNARSMPPFLVVGDGSCGEYQDNHWLADEEVELFKAWADNGAPEGNGYEIQLPALPSLDGDVVEHRTPDFLPAIVGGDRAEFDEYRCFRSGEVYDTTKYMTGYEVVPGYEAIVHHVIGMPVVLDNESRIDGKTNEERMDELEAEDGRDGWPCFIGAGDGVDQEFDMVSWAPGQGVVKLPEGVGIALEAGAVMVYQVHYNLVDPDTRGESDQTLIKLQLEDEVESAAFFVLNDAFLAGSASIDELPPGQDSVEVTYGFTTPAPFRVVGTLPHMHERGRTLNVTTSSGDGESKCLMDVPGWDFNWQRIYLYDEPVRMSIGDRVEVTCTYDTSGDDDPIYPGWGTNNEMCLPGLLVTL